MVHTDPSSHSFFQRVRGEIRRIVSSQGGNYVPILLFTGFFFLYRWFAFALYWAKARPLQENNLLFQLDALRSVLYLTSTTANFYRTSVHPLYALFVNPLGSLLTRVVQEPFSVAIYLTAFLGAVNVFAAYFYFYRMSRKVLNAAILALFFGFSSSQLILSAVPDTATLAILSLILTYTLFWTSCRAEDVPDKPVSAAPPDRGGMIQKITRSRLMSQGGFFIPWVLVGIFTIGVTITNFAQAVICYQLSILGRKDKKSFYKLSIAYVFCVLVCAGALALLQKAIYPSSALFTPGNLREEFLYASPLFMTQPLRVLWQVLKHLFIVNLVAPFPSVVNVLSFFPGISFAGSEQFSFWGVLALIIGLGLFALNLRSQVYRRNARFFMGLVLCLVVNGIMHSFYGISPKGSIELFPYSGNFTLIVITLLLGWSLFPARRWMLAGLLLSCGFLSINNVAMLDRISAVFNDVNTIQTANPRIKELAAALYTYRQEKNDFQAEFTGLHELPPAHFFTFGMGDRPKLMYKDGMLFEALSGKVLYRWDAVEELFVPPAYTVVVKTRNGKDIFIREDSKGIYIDEDDRSTAVFAGSEINLPAFAEYRYPAILKVLHQEILFNIKDAQPLPNLFVYDRPWYRDAAMVGRVLVQTHNTGLIQDWILGLRSPYDGNNHNNEPDNLGEALYLISLVSDRSHPLVPQILAELNGLKKDDYIEGLTDFGLHPVYQTRWAKYGLKSLGLADPFQVPNIQEGYDTLFWLDAVGEERAGESLISSINYPYLTFASAHYLGQKAGWLAYADYPLTWEVNASQANYEKMAVIGPDYVNNRIAAPHTWHAAEAFLYLISLKK